MRKLITIISIVSAILLLGSLVIARETGDAFFRNLSVSGTATVANSSFTTLAVSTMTATYQITADKFNDGVAYLKDGSLVGALTVASSSATITNTLTTKVIDFAVNLDTTTAPASTGIVGLTSAFKMYVSTGTNAGNWELIGSQS